MHNIITNFDQIISFAKNMNIPIDRKRAILREYLQVKFISVFYSLPNSHKLALCGDTSLRLLMNINRFSDSIHFVNLGISEYEIAKMFSIVIKKLKFEGYDVSLDIPNLEWRSIDMKKEEKELLVEKTHFDINFKSILHDLHISDSEEDLLKIRITYDSSWKGIVPENFLLNKYGFIESVVGVNKNQILVQKLINYIYSDIPPVKDLYDIIWLYSQDSRIDEYFSSLNSNDLLKEKLIEKNKSFVLSENIKNKLYPYLFDFSDTRKLGLFEIVMSRLITSKE